MERRFTKRSTDHRAQLIFSLFTFGLWLPIWLLLTYLSSLRPWRCTRCGAVRGEVVSNNAADAI
jgi:hypothetical protein